MKRWFAGSVLLLSACGMELSTTVPAPSVEAQALFSRRVTALVGDIFVAYDHNKNGVLELTRPSEGHWLRRVGNWLFWQDETTRTTHATYRSERDITQTTRIYTRLPLFFAADADHDRVLTLDELTTFIAERYDQNHDGELSARGLRFWREKNEVERFDADYRERLLESRDRNAPRPSPTPSAPHI